MKASIITRFLLFCFCGISFGQDAKSVENLA